MRFWFGKNKNGRLLQESEKIRWDAVSNTLSELYFSNNGQIISLPPNLDYIQGKSASASLNGENFTVESRYIGFKKGNIIVKVRVDKSNNIQIQIEDINEPTKPNTNNRS
jgi:hypothetical protein